METRDQREREMKKRGRAGGEREREKIELLCTSCRLSSLCLYLQYIQAAETSLASPPRCRLQKSADICWISASTAPKTPPLFAKYIRINSDHHTRKKKGPGFHVSCCVCVRVCARNQNYTIIYHFFIITFPVCPLGGALPLNSDQGGEERRHRLWAGQCVTSVGNTTEVLC